TDGQIFLDADLFNSGIRPAINVGLSVSRVGGNAQTKAMKQVAGTLRLELAQFRDVAAFAQFGSDLDKATQAQLARGGRLVEILKQGQYAPVPFERQVLVIYAGTNGHLDDLDVSLCGKFEEELNLYVDSRAPEVLQEFRTKKALDEELLGKMKNLLCAFKEEFRAVDRGMCGSFNANIIRRAAGVIAEEEAAHREMSLQCVGRKGRDYFRRRRPIRRERVDFFRSFGYAAAAAIARELMDRFVQEEIDSVVVVY